MIKVSGKMKYSVSLRAVHWAMAALIFGLIAVRSCARRRAKIYGCPGKRRIGEDGLAIRPGRVVNGGCEVLNNRVWYL